MSGCTDWAAFGVGYCSTLVYKLVRIARFGPPFCRPLGDSSCGVCTCSPVSVFVSSPYSYEIGYICERITELCRWLMRIVKESTPDE